MKKRPANPVPAPLPPGPWGKFSYVRNKRTGSMTTTIHDAKMFPIASINGALAVHDGLARLFVEAPSLFDLLRGCLTTFEQMVEGKYPSQMHSEMMALSIREVLFRLTPHIVTSDIPYIHEPDPAPEPSPEQPLAPEEVPPELRDISSIVEKRSEKPPTRAEVLQRLAIGPLENHFSRDYLLLVARMLGFGDRPNLIPRDLLRRLAVMQALLMEVNSQVYSRQVTAVVIEQWLREREDAQPKETSDVPVVLA